MKLPAFLTPQDQTTTLFRVFGTPIVIKGWMSFPYSQLVVGVGGFIWHARRHPRSAPAGRLRTAALAALILPACEWCHNLGHAAAARAVGAPMDAILVSAGMPLCIYYHPEAPQVTPRQHILRSLGGPLTSLLLFLWGAALQRIPLPGTIARQAAGLFTTTNGIIAIIAWLPIPILDGGALLKWRLVADGNTPAQAERRVRQVNSVTAALLGGICALLRRRQPIPAALTALLSCLAFFFAAGWLKEKHATG